MQTKAKATTAQTSSKKSAAKTAASDSPAKKPATAKKLAATKETAITKGVKTTTRKAPTKPVVAQESAKETSTRKVSSKSPTTKVKSTRTKVIKAVAADSTETAAKPKRKITRAVAKVDSVATKVEAKTATKTSRGKKAAEPVATPEKKTKRISAATKATTTAKTAKTGVTKASVKPVSAKKATTAKATTPKVVAKAKVTKARTKKAEPVVATPEKETPLIVEEKVQEVAITEKPSDLPKSSTQKAFEAAAELAPLVQSHKSNGGTEVNAHEAQKAAEFLMNSMATKHDEHIVIDGITIPTQAELLEMPEEDYMNERQVAFFKWLLKQRETELKSNAGQTTENLRETTIAPDPADRATIEEEHALELRTRDRERKLLKKVQEALRRLENGEFGWCEETGEPIGIPRLLARPTATLSLEAQQRREQRQKLYGD